MKNSIHIEIILPTIAGFLFIFILVVYIMWRTRFGKKPDVSPQLGLDGIMPSDGRRKKSGTLQPHVAADIERAQKFRERARAVTAGRPKFKTSRKGRSYRPELSYNTLENHPLGDKITFRRISEDRTSSFSAYSITDVESRGMVDNSGCFQDVDEEYSVSSFDPRRTSIKQVENEEDSV